MTDRRTDGRADGQTDARGKTICLPNLKGGDIKKEKEKKKKKKKKKKENEKSMHRPRIEHPLFELESGHTNH